MDVQYLNPRNVNPRLVGQQMCCIACMTAKLYQEGFTFHAEYKDKESVHLQAEWFCSLQCLIKGVQGQGMPS